MNIKELFEKDIHRNINGVIKVGQQDNENVRQELDEYVVTKELERHFNTFFDRYTNSLDTPTDKMGVWISGFFGSGKSHFLKILSYLLANTSIEQQQAIDFFDEKRVPDPLLRASMARAVIGSTDVILFNIDSKAEANSKNQRDSIVRVFQKVFDEHLGYFGSVPAIAQFERTLDQKGQYQTFKQAFAGASGSTWEENRDAWLFHQEEISRALEVSTGMGIDAANRLVEAIDQNYTNSVEKFAQTVRQYLDSKGAKHRLLFMVDEVGQYIGESPDLMLNLQTVVEDLGIHCGGKAWVIVTSQEAMDEITKNRIRGNDFSKIVGRFYKPLSLSSANTDEVIKLRLLDKTAAARTALEIQYHDKQAILKNQINFSADCADLPGYKDVNDFQSAYPFVPYQFNLLQAVFTQIRVMGSAGKHLASGERSLLDAFQIAAQTVADKSIGTLVPFHTFYLAIEGFLDSSISQAINQAKQNSQLQDFDVEVLKLLFMVKYVDVNKIRPNPDNLTTLCLSHIDQDRLALKAQIQESLQRLERQTLIQRTGDEYSFLTHEEQDIGREIKNIEVDPGEITTEFQTMVWDTIFTDKKLKYDARHQYDFNRKLDYQAKGIQTNDFGIHIVTPYADRYKTLQVDIQCFAETASGQEVLVRLPDDPHLLDEVNELVKTAKYIRRKHSGNLTASIRKILDGRAEENSKRKERIEQTLRRLISEADLFAVGSKIQVSSRDVRSVLTDGLTALIDNVHTKLNYVASGFNTEAEVTQALTRNFEAINTDGEYPNAPAHTEMGSWLADEARSHKRVSIRSLTDKFLKRPFGWSEFDTLGVLAELVNLGKVELRKAQATVNPKESGLVVKLRSKSGVDEYLVRLCNEVDPASLRVARDLARDLLEGTPPSDTVKLYEAYQTALKTSCDRLQAWIDRSKSEQLPFGDLMAQHATLLQNLAAQDDAAAFFGAIRSQREELEDYVEDVQKIQSFFESQLGTFLKARADLKLLESELCHLNEPDAIAKIAQVRQILTMPDPTSQVPQLGQLLQPVQALIQVRLQTQRDRVAATGARVRDKVGQYAIEAHPQLAAQLDLAQLTQPIDRVTIALEQAQTIDSAIARERDLEQLEQQLMAQVDTAAATLLTQQQLAGAEVTVTKPMVTVRLSQVAGKSILESSQDVDEYLERVKMAIVAEIDRGKRVRLE
jgi:Family of unknown function (DUF6079)